MSSFNSSLSPSQAETPIDLTIWWLGTDIGSFCRAAPSTVCTSSSLSIMFSTRNKLLFRVLETAAFLASLEAEN